jgi:glycosyltransferase involved in cell wall biosynthesis
MSTRTAQTDQDGASGLRGGLRHVVRFGRALTANAVLFAGPGRGDALTLVRAIAGGSRDAALMPRIDAALARHRSTGLIALRAQTLETAGELTAARNAFAEIADRNARAKRRVAILDGRLVETDTAWLPHLAGEPEHLEPVSRRRILHIAKSAAPERWSGFTIRTMHNLHAQQAAGFEPIMVTEIGWPRVAGVTDVKPLVDVEGVPHYRLDRGPDYDPSLVRNDRRIQDTTDDLLPLVRELRPAILHAHSGYRGGEHALMALALRERLGIPVVYEVRGLFEAVWSPDPEAAAGSELFARRLAQETRILHDVDGVLAISEALADDMVARGIPREKIGILPNGIDPNALSRPDRDTILRAELGLDGRFVVGYLGNLDHWREGIDVLIAAVARLHAAGRRDVALLVVGDGTRRGSLEAEAARLGVTDFCRFTGRVPHDRVAQYYAQMDLFANTRVEERAARYITPLKPYEAMALGVPVLVSDLPALREIVDPPHRGLTAPVGDAVGLADAIARLADDPVERSRIAEAGRDWVRTERTWRANGDRYRAAYERILGPLDG